MQAALCNTNAMRYALAETSLSLVRYLIKNNTPTITAIPMGSMITLRTKPVMMYITKETPATSIAYGSCVETWLMWFDCAPAEAMIVVSEMGEQWSPQTAPAMQAEMAMIMISPPLPPNTSTTIGINIFPDEISQMMCITIAACLGGAVMGDHCSPISDTTIMASTGGKSDHINHVSTQIPYALLVAAMCVVFYAIAGVVQSVIVTPFAIAAMVGVLLFIKKIQMKKTPSQSKKA